MYGPAFNIPAAEVCTYLGKFMPGNSITDLRRLSLSEHNNGNMDFKVFKEYCYVVGANTINVLITYD